MISSKEIEEVLNELHSSNRHEVKYAIKLFVPILGQSLYINKQAGKEAAGLVIHPRYESLWSVLSQIDGVHTTNTLNHKSSYTEFPKRLNKGKNPIPFGIPFGFDSKNALKKFVNELSNLPVAYTRDPDTEISNAKEYGEFRDLSETEMNRLVSCRKGQGNFRRDLIALWKNCSVTGCKQVSLLKASHIKPWRDASNLERLDPYNGLLLTPNIDSLFDGGYITFDDYGKIIISSSITSDTYESFGLVPSLHLSFIDAKTKKYMKYHRKYIFFD